jgi:hypothetical protein
MNQVPGTTLRPDCNEAEDAADNDAVFEHVVVVIAPFAGRARGAHEAGRHTSGMSHVDLVCRRHAVGMPLCGLMPRPDIALAAQPNVIRSVARQALTASRAQLEPLTRILAAALPPCFVNIAAHRRAFSSTRRPAAVIRTLATSILREPAIIRSAVAVARPASTSSIMPLIANPCACRMPSGQPLSQDASNSSARMRSGLMSRLWRRVGIVHCLRALYRFNRYLDTLFQCMEPNSSLGTCVDSRGGPCDLTTTLAPARLALGPFL